jgi:hypothetical protein
VRKILLAVFLTVLNVSLYAQNEEPLQPFEFLVGGVWASNSTIQTYEWGVGQQTVYSKLYFVEADTARLAGEITWFWHPGEQKIKGFGHLPDGNISFFDYTTEFESPKIMVNRFYGYGGSADGVLQYEKLEFLNDREYLWTYYNEVAGELQPAYSITFIKQN